jgi:polyketide biosynthesis enoyl-CoA hydratase PksI
VTDILQVSIGDPVAVIRLTDAANRNVLTPDLISGFTGALDHAVADPSTRVVLVTGLPDIFCAGASQATLLADPASGATLGCYEMVRSPLFCPLPVVAAMRGHAIGGGLVLGLYADLAVLSERSVYTANFLNYGLMPCLGTTWVLTNRLGHMLGTEMLLGAARFRGRELRERGAPVSVVAHDAVEPTAAGLAERIAGAPRMTLEYAKAALASTWREEADNAFKREVGGHLDTLAQPALRHLATTRYGQS